MQNCGIYPCNIPFDVFASTGTLIFDDLVLEYSELIEEEIIEIDEEIVEEIIDELLEEVEEELVEEINVSEENLIITSSSIVDNNWVVYIETNSVNDLVISASGDSNYGLEVDDDLVFNSLKCDNEITPVDVVLEDGTVIPYDVYLKLKRIKEIDVILR